MTSFETSEDVTEQFHAWFQKNAHRFGLGDLFGDPGRARETIWQAEDGWLICYTTTRVEGGKHDGKFLVRTLKPTGKGARTDPSSWVENYRREYAVRKKAKARAEALYRKHSPKWDARYPT